MGGADRPDLLENRLDLGPEEARDVWHARQLRDNKELDRQESGTLRGEVADLKDFDDGQTSVVVVDEERGRFTIVDVPSEKADDLAPGDAAKVPRGRSSILKTGDREMER